jgi:hypothetical protein
MLKYFAPLSEMFPTLSEVFHFGLICLESVTPLTTSGYNRPEPLPHQLLQLAFQLLPPQVFGDDLPVFIQQETIGDGGYGV